MCSLVTHYPKVVSRSNGSHAGVNGHKVHKTGIDVLDPALSPLMPLGRKVNDVARARQLPCCEDKHSTRPDFFALACRRIGLEILGERILELKCDAVSRPTRLSCISLKVISLRPFPCKRVIWIISAPGDEQDVFICQQDAIAMVLVQEMIVSSRVVSQQQVGVN